METIGQYDLLITGGTVIDGTGVSGFRADVGIQAGRIAAIGQLQEAQAPITLDAANQVVCPGFVDIHTHSDLTVLINPGLESSALQGVTTEVTGNCGLSVGLAGADPVFRLERRFANLAPEIQWEGMGEFLVRVEEQGIAINLCTLAGHNTIRKRIMGMDARPPQDSELQCMRSLLREAISEGAVGFSTGLEYPPGRYSETPEIIALAEIAAEAGLIYTSHLRNESDHLVASVQEALLIGEKAHLPVQLSHHKAEGGNNWGKVHETLEIVEAARRRGQDVTLDQYPYTAFMTGLAIPVFPTWALGGSEAEMKERLTDSETRAQLLTHIRALKMDWSLVRIAIAHQHREYQGRTLAELAAAWLIEPEEAVLKVLEDERGFVAATYYMMSENDVRFVMQFPHTFVASDAASSANHGPLSHDLPHPRTFGTFPRVLGRYVRDLGILSLETAIAKMTSMPARRIGIRDRGILAEGMAADIVIFDPAQVIDRAHETDPRAEPLGIDAVVVNGQVITRKGQMTGSRPGKVLRQRAGVVAG